MLRTLPHTAASEPLPPPNHASHPLHLAAAYYRGAQGIVLVYDVSRAETFDSLADIWLREVDMYGTVEECIKMVVANKSDLVGGWLSGC